MKSTLYKALIFDMGEVLVKTYNQKPRLILAQRFNLSSEDLEKLVYYSDSALKSFAGEISDKDHFLEVIRTLGDPDGDYRAFQNSFWGGDDIDKEMLAFISSLKHNYKLGLLSNAMDTTRERLDEKYNLSSYFHQSIYSYEVKMAKPSPEIYMFLLNKLGVIPQQTIFIDDLRENIEAARTLGLTTIIHKSSSQTIEKIKELLEIN